MKMERMKNAKRNLVFGITEKIVMILLPFITRTVLIYQIGTDYAGLGELFKSTLNMLNLAELGFSSAIVSSMYSAVAKDNTNEICVLLNLYRKVYIAIGIVISSIGILMIPLLPKLIHGTWPPNIDIVWVYLIYLMDTVMGYFFFAYYKSLLTALQREDVVCKVNIGVNLLLNIIQISIVLIWHNYYIYIVFMPVMTFLSNIFTAILSRKLYPLYFCKGKIKRENINGFGKKIIGLMISKIKGMARNSFDNMFISMYLGLVITTIYGNYYYIMRALVLLTQVLTNSIRGIIGNTVYTESMEQNYKRMNVLNFFYMWISGWLCICFVCLVQPFMKIWMGEERMASNTIVIMLGIYFYMLTIGDIRALYIEGKGLWWNFWKISVFEAVSNVALNWILCKQFGLFGIVLATIITIFFFQCIGASVISFQCCFPLKYLKDYFIQHGRYAFCMIIGMTITIGTCSLTDGMKNISEFLMRGFICAFFPNIIFFLLYRGTLQYKESIQWLYQRIGRRIPFTVFYKIIGIENREGK